MDIDEIYFFINEIYVQMKSLLFILNEALNQVSFKILHSITDYVYPELSADIFNQLFFSSKRNK